MRGLTNNQTRVADGIVGSIPVFRFMHFPFRMRSVRSPQKGFFDHSGFVQRETSMQRAVTIEGSRLAADIFAPDDLRSNQRYPAILLCHGWGGLKSGLARHVLRFAEHGFVALAFDYRGWGESDGRIISSANGPTLKQAGAQTLEVRVAREIVDPIDQLLDVRNAFSFLLGEDCVDTSTHHRTLPLYLERAQAMVSGANPPKIMPEDVWTS